MKSSVVGISIRRSENASPDIVGKIRRANLKPGTGDPLHTQEPVTVASFRTWRGWREGVARDRCLTRQF